MAAFGKLSQAIIVASGKAKRDGRNQFVINNDGYRVQDHFIDRSQVECEVECNGEVIWYVHESDQMAAHFVH